MNPAQSGTSAPLSNNSYASKAIRAYCLLVRWAGPVCLSLFLLLLRIVWGWAFFMAGKGKLGDIQKPIEFFRQLHIPAPAANAWLVAFVECFGGLLLLLGLGSRAVCVALVANMTVAYLTADREAVHALFADSDVTKFSAAAPFWFMAASFVVLALGPGIFSIDGLLKRFVFGNAICQRTLPLAAGANSI